MASSAKFNPQTAVVLLFIFVTGAGVLINLNPANGRIAEVALYSPVGAMALFAGAYFNCGWKAFLFPLGSLFLSDFIFHQTVFKQYSSGLLYNGWWWVYGVFTRMVLAGKWMMHKVTVGSFVHCLTAAIPFEWRFLAGTLACGAVLFGGFALLGQRMPFCNNAFDRGTRLNFMPLL